MGKGGAVKAGSGFNGSALDLTALAKSFSEGELKKARKGLPSGKHEVDFLVRVQGSVTVGASYERTPTTSIPVLETLCVLMAQSGFTKEEVKQKLVAAMSDVIQETGAAKGSIMAEYGPLVEGAMKDVQSLVKSLPKVPVEGAVTTKVTLTIVPPPAAEVAQALPVPTAAEAG